MLTYRTNQDAAADSTTSSYVPEPGGSVRGERANFTVLVLCCINLVSEVGIQILQQNMSWKAFAPIYTMYSFAPFRNRIPKTRKTMRRKEPGPYSPGKTWPGEAHKQPQLATQYYLRARDEECLRIRNKVLTSDFQFNSM